MNRKAIGIGEVFVYIVSALTFALIMIFGYKAIGGFLDRGEQVEFYQFKTDLENSVKKIYTEYGSVRREEFRLPTKYTKICFVDVEFTLSAIDAEIQNLCGINQVACDVWKSVQNIPDADKFISVEQNVFLTPIAPVPIKVYKIRIKDGSGYLCPEINNGKFCLELEGLGGSTQISKINCAEVNG